MKSHFLINNKMLGVFVAAALALSALVLALAPTTLQTANGQDSAMISQTGVLVGYGGSIFGLVNVDSNGHVIDIAASTNYVPQADHVFEAWLVDGNYAASGYALSLGQFIKDGTLTFNENMVNSNTYTDIIVTTEPRNDKDPKPAYSTTVAAYYLTPPFGQ
jgi:hypothetical protein